MRRASSTVGRRDLSMLRYRCVCVYVTSAISTKSITGYRRCHCGGWQAAWLLGEEQGGRYAGLVMCGGVPRAIGFRSFARRSARKLSVKRHLSVHVDVRCTRALC